MLRTLCLIFVIVALFSACSKASDPLDPLTVNENENQTDVDAERTSNMGDGLPEIWGAVEITWDTDSGEISSVSRSLETAASHFKVSAFLNPPKCASCINILVKSSDVENGSAEISVSLRNPTNLTGYDVRGMIRIPAGSNASILNPDGYTSLFTETGYQSPTPFRLFSRSSSDHSFGPGQIFAESYKLKALPSSGIQSLSLVVTAGYPTAPGDVSSIANFRQTGKLLKGGGNAILTIDVLDLQDDIGGVKVDCAQLGMNEVWLIPSAGKWSAQIKNSSAVAGIYNLTVSAFSPNKQNAVTSNIYRAVVFSDFDSYRNELLNLVNADRSNEGLAPLVLDDLLNTAAQFHGQDMSDRKFFSHQNLDGQSPWDRMKYYGITYGTAGENIAVGQDTPKQVETDWMNSSGHRANILNPKFKKIGLGIVEVKPGDMFYPGYYWVQAFTD